MTRPGGLRPDNSPANCRDCDRQLIANIAWKNADEMMKDIWRHAGAAQNKGRGLCAACYARHHGAGTLIDFERVTVSREQLLDEWEHMDHTNGSQSDKIRHAAPRLGMTPKALENALLRAGIYSDMPRRGGIRKVAA